MGSLYLGIDTSNYRTSAALVDHDGRVLSSKAVLLDVPEGERGLRQSEAFFRHSNRLPEYLAEIFSDIDTSDIAAVGVSERPRRAEGSYMPCFMAGVNAASITGTALGVPVFGFSHQEGHAAAILESGGQVPPERSLLFHLSGGTTEALICEPDGLGYSMEIAGGTLDISIGQLLDRFGVALGLLFPSGEYLDDVAYEYLEDHGFDPSKVVRTGVIPQIRIREGYFNLSGAETRLMKFVDDKDRDREKTCHVTAELFITIAGLLADEVKYIKKERGADETVFAGGVASSRTIRKILSDVKDIDIRFGAPGLSGDNAVGTALLAKRIYETGNSNTGK